jgi:hypothetical protein
MKQGGAYETHQGIGEKMIYKKCVECFHVVPEFNGCIKKPTLKYYCIPLKRYIKVADGIPQDCPYRDAIEMIQPDLL